MKVANFSRVATVDIGSKYHLDRITLSTFSGKIGRFLRNILQHRQVLYDWGQHHFFSCDVRFSVDYGKKVITDSESGILIDNEQFAECDPDKLHEAISYVFEGEWGPTSVDTIIRLENSGINVILCNTSECGPENPEEFMRDIRTRLKNQQ